MNRRTFIFSSSAVAVAIPVAYYFKKNKWRRTNPVTIPEFLSTICEEPTIKAIGAAYIKQFTAENNKQQLKKAILFAEKSAAPDMADDTAVKEFINAKITSEFKNGQTLLIEGWILAATEARQCALYYLTY
jgi:hypothetical protein